jgi:hypothetical protein
VSIRAIAREINVDNVLSDILRNVTFNTIDKAKSLALSKCLSFQRPQLYYFLEWQKRLFFRVK